MTCMGRRHRSPWARLSQLLPFHILQLKPVTTLMCFVVAVCSVLGTQGVWRRDQLLLFISQPECEPLEVKDVVFPVLSLDLLQNLEHSRHLEDVISKWTNRGEKTSTDVYAKLEKQKCMIRPPEGTEGALGLRWWKCPFCLGWARKAPWKCHL